MCKCKLPTDYERKKFIRGMKILCRINGLGNWKHDGYIQRLEGVEQDGGKRHMKIGNVLLCESPTVEYEEMA
ncbi:hypothetical protein U1Q18_014688 [Sarracenia purpurea var. burkii]